MLIDTEKKVSITVGDALDYLSQVITNPQEVDANREGIPKVETANYEVDYCSWKDGIVLYATGNLEDLPHLGGKVGQMASGMGVLVETPYQEKLGFFSNLAEAREFCEKMGLPMPGTSCVPGW